jgi:RsiW-degrading membrane proteinase PrsW (M82 family)
MAMMEFVFTLQTSGSQPQAGSQSAEGYAWYFLYVVLALVLALVVLMFIRTSAKRLPKR